MVGIVFCNKLALCPYADKYIDACKKLGVPYEVIIWDRSGEDCVYPENFRVFREKSAVNKSKWKKIGAFWRFRRFLKQTIRENRYKKLIMLTTLPAILCYRELKHWYRGKYIFDFRDMSFEQYAPYRKLVGKLCRHAAFTCISSPGFVKVLGQQDYVIANNFRYADVAIAENCAKPCGQPIRLLNIGVSRGDAFNRAVADMFGNDARFAVDIVGMGNDTPEFLEYVKRYPNIHVQGTYNNEEKKAFIRKTDMLLYYYPCNFNCNVALANKYYDGLIFKKPLIGNINTYSGRRVVEKQVGVALDLNDPGFADDVYAYMQTLDISSFVQHASEELNCVLEEDQLYLKRIDDFLKS